MTEKFVAGLMQKNFEHCQKAKTSRREKTHFLLHWSSAPSIKRHASILYQKQFT